MNTMADAVHAARALDLAQLDVGDPRRFKEDTIGPVFDRLREEDPVHFCQDGGAQRGSYWSVTRFKDIMEVEVNHDVFSSDVWLGGINIRDVPMEFRRPMFIAMDPPEHDEQRKAVSPIVAPGNLAEMEATIRERTQSVLDSLPVGETFNWVDKVSIELTTPCWPRSLTSRLKTVTCSPTGRMWLPPT